MPSATSATHGDDDDESGVAAREGHLHAAVGEVEPRTSVTSIEPGGPSFPIEARAKAHVGFVCVQRLASHETVMALTRDKSAGV